jgi:hypothetical protein
VEENGTVSKREWIRDNEFAEICKAVPTMDIKEVCKLFGRNEVSLVNKLNVKTRERIQKVIEESK